MTDESPPSTLSELQTQIAERHKTLSKRLQQVGHYVMEHTDTVAFSTLSEIAREAGVHASTLVRFANAFGYDGFSEMQKLFKAQFLDDQPRYSARIRMLQQEGGGGGGEGPATPMRIFTEFTRASLQSLEQFHGEVSEQALNDAVDVLEAANAIFVAGVRRSYAAAAYTAYALRHVDRPTHLIDGTGGMFREQAHLIGPHDAVVGFSFAPYGAETIATLRTGREHGARIILVTDSQLSPAYEDADVAFVVKDPQVRSFRTLSSTLCLAQSLCIGLAYRIEDDKPE